MARRRRRRNPLVLLIGFLLLAGWIFIGSNNLTGYSANVPLAIGQSQQQEPFILSRDVSYDFKKIEIEVIEEVKEYFYSDNYTDFSVNYMNSSVWTSSYGAIHNHTNIFQSVINMGMIDIKDNPGMYKMVFTHEYLHYIIARYNLSTSSETHEALAEVYTWYTNEEVMINQWGADDSGRSPPYDKIMKEVLANDYSCLKRVFVQKIFINGTNDFLQKINSNCNLNITLN